MSRLLPTRLQDGGDNWLPLSPKDATFRTALEQRLDKAHSDKRVSNLHGVVIARNGRLVLERYFAGDDYMHGTRLGNVAFTPDTLHDLRSVSKSIVCLLYGIALADGKVPFTRGATSGLVPRVRGSRRRSCPQPLDDPSRADHDDGNGLG